MINDNDIKKMKKVFVIKEELKGTENYFRYDINVMKEENKEFRNEFSKFKDSVLKTLDWLVEAFKKFDEEHIVLSHQNSRIIKQQENHDIRIKKLESQQAFE